MLLQFRLRPLEEVEPWGGDHPALHWFGLSDGWCWWQAGPQQLFRYTQSALDYWAAESPEHPKPLPYVDYQVVRPWEDLLDALPDILAPVPDDLAERLQDPDKWQRLQDMAWTWAEARDDERSWGLCHTAFLWWSERKWDAGYLRHPPKIWLRVQGDTFHLRWDNRAVTLGGLRPEIAIDLAMLAREQPERASWLTNALTRKPPEQDWDNVRAAINEAERMCYNNRVEGL